MTSVEFCEKYGESQPVEMLKTNDILMRVASNLSDSQEMLGLGIDINQNLNKVKEYIFDYMSVLRCEEYKEHVSIYFQETGERLKD